MPSVKILEQKKAVVAELSEKLKNATAGVVVSYAGITVADDTALRQALRKANVEYKVYKNSITGRACDEAGYSDIKPYLTGMTAIAYASTEDDAVSPAKILAEYAEKIPTFELKCGFIEGGVIGKEAVEELAKTPSKPVLIGKVLGSLQSPICSLCYALQAIVDKAEGTPEAAAE